MQHGRFPPPLPSPHPNAQDSRCAVCVCVRCQIPAWLMFLSAVCQSPAWSGRHQWDYTKYIHPELTGGHQRVSTPERSCCSGAAAGLKAAQYHGSASRPAQQPGSLKEHLFAQIWITDFGACTWEWRYFVSVSKGLKSHPCFPEVFGHFFFFFFNWISVSGLLYHSISSQQLFICRASWSVCSRRVSSRTGGRVRWGVTCLVPHHDDQGDVVTPGPWPEGGAGLSGQGVWLCPPLTLQEETQVLPAATGQSVQRAGWKGCKFGHARKMQTRVKYEEVKHKNLLKSLYFFLCLSLWHMFTDVYIFCTHTQTYSRFILLLSYTESDMPWTTNYSEADTSRLLIGQEVQE